MLKLDIILTFYIVKFNSFRVKARTLADFLYEDKLSDDVCNNDNCEFIPRNKE